MSDPNIQLLRRYRGYTVRVTFWSKNSSHPMEWHVLKDGKRVLTDPTSMPGAWWTLGYAKSDLASLIEVENIKKLSKQGLLRRGVETRRWKWPRISRPEKDYDKLRWDVPRFGPESRWSQRLRRIAMQHMGCNLKLRN